MPQIIKTDNINIPSLDVFHTLNEAQLLHYYEPDLGIFIAESPKVIERAMNAGYEPLKLLIEERSQNSEHDALIGKMPETAEIYIAGSVNFEDVTGLKMTRGALCAMRRKQLPSIEEFIKGKNRIVVLENVENPTNMGALFRSAAALGMDGIILTRNSADPLYRKANRVSMGTVFQIPWTVFDVSEKYPENFLNILHKEGVKTVSMALREDSFTIDDERLHSEEKLAIFMGNEGDGLLPETIEKGDYTVMIPMAYGVDSLNVAAAGTLAFWELKKSTSYFKDNLL